MVTTDHVSAGYTEVEIDSGRELSGAYHRIYLRCGQIMLRSGIAHLFHPLCCGNDAGRPR